MQSKLRNVEDLSRGMQAQMYSLYQKYYAETNEGTFYDDLRSKDIAILLFDEDTLVGFSLQLSYRSIYRGAAVRVLYSGDTIVEQAYWGQDLLMRQWLEYAGDLSRSGTEPLYWLLLSKGQRTYRYLSIFFRRYYPHYLHTDPELASLTEHLATERFADMYNPTSGLVDFGTSKAYLKPEWQGMSDAIAHKAEIEFFLGANPNYASGQELVCLAPLTSENLIPRARKVFDHA